MENKENFTNSYKSTQPLISNNKMLLAAIGGAAAGIAIANLLGSERGKAWLGKIGESAGQLANQYKDQINIESISNLIMSKFKKNQ
jgi:hypothetical protein